MAELKKDWSAKKVAAAKRQATKQKSIVKKAAVRKTAPKKRLGRRRRSGMLPEMDDYLVERADGTIVPVSELTSAELADNGDDDPENHQDEPATAAMIQFLGFNPDDPEECKD